MKKKLLPALLGLLALVTVTHAAAPVPAGPPTLAPLEQHAQAATMAAQILTRYHYKALPLDDAMSEKIFARYLKALDPARMFLLQSDIDQLAPAKTRLDDAINGGDLRLPFAMFNLYEARYFERMAYAKTLLAGGFDFTQPESYQYDRSKEAWPKDRNEANDIWRKRVKNEWLRLKLAGKDEKSIRETLAKRYDGSLTRAQRIKSEDVFQIFLDSYASSIEPHTDYLGPRDSANFGISMKLSLVGIGAVLQERDEYTTIRELTPGGPAIRSEKIKVGDRIVAVGQGANGAMQEVIGWRLDDVVQLIRGAKDSVVRLEILPADGGADVKAKVISLVRDQIRLEQQAAKKSVITVKDGNAQRQVGVIALPTFYLDFEARGKGDPNYKSATRDIAKLLEELKKEKIDTVLVDLRNNGGGSLLEAIELTGLFIGKGPVVQQRDAQGRIRVESDNVAAPVWTGQVGVLINRGSASASEIFAAALQDYGRGLIIGEQSFGKGTVQTMLNLDQMARSDKPKFGELKMTVAQFFRINGGTTQLKGVTPDVSLPSMSDPENYGESSYDNALPWVQIPAAEYRAVDEVKSVLPQLQIRHETRIAKDRDFQFYKEDIAEFLAQRKKNAVSLVEAERRREMDAQEARAKLRKAANVAVGDEDDDTPAGRDDGLQAGERTLAAELAAEKSRKKARDFVLNEAAHILADKVEFLRTSTKLATRARPVTATAANPAEKIAK